MKYFYVICPIELAADDSAELVFVKLQLLPDTVMHRKIALAM